MPKSFIRKKNYFDLLRTNFINKSDKVGGHEKGGQIWNRAIMEGANMGVPLYYKQRMSKI